MRISEEARENRADFLSKSYARDVSKCERKRVLTIPDPPHVLVRRFPQRPWPWRPYPCRDTSRCLRRVSHWYSIWNRGDKPFVVCCRLVSFMTSNVVPKSLFNNVPIVNEIRHYLSTIASCSLFPVDWEPKTETMLYANPESRKPHLSIWGANSGLQSSVNEKLPDIQSTLT